MMQFLILGILTAIIVFLAIKLFKKTRELSFIVGTFFLYYWSLLGSWFFIYDQLTNNAGKSFGLHYYYLFEKMFHVKANTDYVYSNIAYGLFIIIIQLILLWKVPAYKEPIERKKKIGINHYLIILISVFSVIFSFMLVWKQILIAAKYEESVYYITRHYPERFFTLHQLLNQVAVAAIFIGLIILVCGDRCKYFTGKTDRKVFFAYFFGVLFVEGFMLFLGNKRELMFGGIFALLFYVHNMNYKINWRMISLFLVMIGTPLFFNDGLRAYSPTFLTKYFDVSQLVFIPPDVEYTQFSMSGAASLAIFSNEMFAGHFSMYGVIHNDVDPTYGSSLKSLVASFIPRAIVENRPAPIYDYYVAKLGINTKAGFTIHHATGWFLNFSWFGIMLGAACLGLLWSWLYSKMLSLKENASTFSVLFFGISCFTFAAFIPSLIRTGPEGYKALFFEAMLLPVLLIYFAALAHKRFQKK